MHATKRRRAVPFAAPPPRADGEGAAGGASDTDSLEAADASDAWIAERFGMQLGVARVACSVLRDRAEECGRREASAERDMEDWRWWWREKGGAVALPGEEAALGEGAYAVAAANTAASGTLPVEEGGAGCVVAVHGLRRSGTEALVEWAGVRNGQKLEWMAVDALDDDGKHALHAYSPDWYASESRGRAAELAVDYDSDEEEAPPPPPPVAAVNGHGWEDDAVPDDADDDTSDASVNSDDLVWESDDSRQEPSVEPRPAARRGSRVSARTRAAAGAEGSLGPTLSADARVAARTRRSSELSRHRAPLTSSNSTPGMRSEPGLVSHIIDQHRCSHCGVVSHETPMMRNGPIGPKTLCNACGLYWRRQCQRM